MECLAVPKLPDGPQWLYEIKLDEYRFIAVKSSGKLNLLSRRRNSFTDNILSSLKLWLIFPTTRSLTARLSH
jgi:ATP-dependent DNA ligase